MSELVHPHEIGESGKNVVAALQERGLVTQVTESGLPEAAAQGRLYVYAGFDPTAPSLHVGHLVPLRLPRSEPVGTTRQRPDVPPRL